jgi:predicted TIM-barrel fold metal-dependent hydrolase
MSSCIVAQILNVWCRSLHGSGKPIVLLLAVLTALLWGGVASVHAQDLPIFDTHIHYNQPDWEVISAEQVLSMLDRAGVRYALVSSTPDDGTLKLYARAPDRIVPFLRPYRSRDDILTWHGDPAVQAYVEERLRRGVYKGIGEFHLSAVEHAEAPVVRRCAELAAQQQLFLHAHVDDTTVEKLLRLHPQVRILWAHAGMTASAATVGRLLGQFPTLWVELAMRSDVAPNGTLAPEWREVFLQHPDRFMVGTDTWVTSQWDTLVEGMRAMRHWLGQLPGDVAQRIAYRNAERLFRNP